MKIFLQNSNLPKNNVFITASGVSARLANEKDAIQSYRTILPKSLSGADLGKIQVSFGIIIP
jgi:hypothetical protein